MAYPDGTRAFRFEVDSFRKHCLLNGLDEIGLTLRHAEKIRAFEERRQRREPVAVQLKIAVLPGDGIGPEIVAQAVRVLRALARDGLAFEIAEAPVGGTAYDAAGDPLPEATLALARGADAILFGAVGGPKYDQLPRAKRPEQALLRLRKELGLFANLRPATIYPELAGASTLRPEVVAGLDLLILRELTGDIYFGQPRGIRATDAGEREGFDTMRYTEAEIRRIAHVGLPGRAQAPAAALLGRQGERARDLAAVARGRHGRRRRVSGRRAHPHVRRQLRPCSWCARRSSSTSS